MVELAEGRLVYALAPGFSEDLAPEIRDGLLQLTGERWLVELVEGKGAPTLEELKQAAKDEEARRIRETPIVKAAFDAFPDAELVDEGKEAVGGNWSKRA